MTMNDTVKRPSLLLQQDARKLIPQFYRDLVAEKTTLIKQKGTETLQTWKENRISEARKIFQNELKDFIELGNDNQKTLLEFVIEFLAINAGQPNTNRNHSARKAKNAVQNVSQVREQIEIKKSIDRLDGLTMKHNARMQLTNAEIKQENDDAYILTTASIAVQALPTMPKDPKAIPAKSLSADTLKDCLQTALLGTAPGRKLLADRSKQEEQQTEKKQAKVKAKAKVKEDA